MTGNFSEEILTQTGTLESSNILFSHPYIAGFWDLITLEFMAKFFVAYFFVVWIALILWVARDISYRSSNAFLQAFSLLIVILLTPLGVFLYLLVRPRKTMIESYYEEVENNLNVLSEIVQERLESTTHLTCPKCEHVVEADFLLCPSCHNTLKHQCISCKREIRESWEVCPYCKTLQVPEKKSKKKEKISQS